MSIPRSKNCAAYTDTIHLYVDAKVSVDGKEDKCAVDLSAFSCQTSGFETPDEATREGLLERGREALAGKSGCVDKDSKLSISTTTNLVGAQELEYAPEKLVELGMASNCYKAGNDPNHATHLARAVCHPMEAMINERGEKVKNTNMKILSNLAVCDISRNAEAQVMEDLRKVAAYNSSQNGYTIQKPEDLSCSFSIMPYV